MIKQKMIKRIESLKSNKETKNENISKCNNSESNQISEISIKEKLDEILGNKAEIINLDVGGKIFTVKLSELKETEDNLIIQTYNKLNLNEDNINKKEVELFFDRSFKYFPVILQYIKNQNFNIKNYKRYDLFYIEKEAIFFNLTKMINEIQNIPKEVKIVSFDSSPRYQNFGTHDLESLNDETLSGGFCLNSPYWIIFELDFEHEINEIKVAGFSPDRSRWAPSNGSNAKVYTSLDNQNWKEVGKLPSNFGNTILTVTLTTSEAKYLKFQHTTYLGLSYLKISPNL